MKVAEYWTILLSPCLRVGKCLQRYSFYYYFFKFILFLRETDRQTDPESKAGSRVRAVSAEPDVGLELTNREIMT